MLHKSRLWEDHLNRRSPEDSLFDRFFRAGFDDLFDNLYARSFNTMTKQNEDGSVSWTVDVPGVKEQDLTVEVLDNTITIKGERKDAHSQYSVNRVFTVPENCDVSSLKAELADGVLTLTAQTAKTEKVAKKIEIQSAKALPENK